MWELPLLTFTEYKKGVDFLKKYPVIEFNTIYDSNCKYVIVGAFQDGNT